MIQNHRFWNNKSRHWEDCLEKNFMPSAENEVWLLSFSTKKWKSCEE